MIEFIETRDKWINKEKVKFVVVTGGKMFEIPNNYEQFHINNIINDYNAKERTIEFRNTY